MREVRTVSLGTVAVDSGALILIDPVYIASHWATPAQRQQMLRAIFEAVDRPDHGGSLSFPHGGPGLLTAVAPGLGDGLYTVTATLAPVSGWGERVTQITLRFLDA
ncbi:MAG: hypothetical protein OWU33_16760 [Firmicutes bacterium]|nr:hypothetical protein [Bacillota bacterium]